MSLLTADSQGFEYVYIWNGFWTFAKGICREKVFANCQFFGGCGFCVDFTFGIADGNFGRSRFLWDFFCQLYDLALIIGIVFCGLVGFHLYLNRKAFQISKKKGAMKWLMNIFIVLALTGVIVIFVVLRHNMQHSSLGGLHGKIGFLFLIFTFVHIIRHKNFFLKNVFVNEKYRSWVCCRIFSAGLLYCQRLKRIMPF